MEQLKLCDSDYRFMSIVWDYAPIPSGKLVKLCNEILGWKKSTTYTTIKKMSEKGYIKNENAFVTVLISNKKLKILLTVIVMKNSRKGGNDDKGYF